VHYIYSYMLGAEHTAGMCRGDRITRCAGHHLRCRWLHKSNTQLPVATNVPG
jgi:hypothetical protein